MEFTVGVEERIQSAESKGPWYQSLTFSSLNATLGDNQDTWAPEILQTILKVPSKDLNGQKTVSVCYFIQLLSLSISMLQMGHETDTPSTQTDNLHSSDWAGVLKQDFAGPSTS